MADDNKEAPLTDEEFKNVTGVLGHRIKQFDPTYNWGWYRSILGCDKSRRT